MEVKPGYKQTDVGVIPEDWCVLPLAALSRSICDGTHYTPRYVAHGVPFYSVENVTARNFTDTKFISESEHTQLVRRCRPERGDILMTRITAGVLGDTVLINWDVEASIYVSLALIKPNNRINPEYLYRYSQSPAFVNDVEKRGLMNATPKKINMIDIGRIPVPVPPLMREQEAIAEALSNAEALIESLENLLAKKRHVKQGATQELLTGRRRLPGFNGKWKVNEIREVLRLLMDYRGRTPKKLGMAWGGGDILALSAANVKMGRIDFSEEANVGSEELYRKWMRQGETRQNDVLMTTEAPLGNVALIPDANKYILSQRTILLRTDPERMDSVFFFHLLSSSHVQDLLLKVSSGTTATGIQRLKFERINIVHPHVPEQTAIAAVLSDMDAEIAVLEAKRAKARQIKQGMMQELLTGKTRIV